MLISDFIKCCAKLCYFHCNMWANFQVVNNLFKTVQYGLQLKNIGERLKNLSSFVTISTSQQGDMTMTVHTELVSASTR